MRPRTAALALRLPLLKGSARRCGSVGSTGPARHGDRLSRAARRRREVTGTAVAADSASERGR